MVQDRKLPAALFMPPPATVAELVLKMTLVSVGLLESLFMPPPLLISGLATPTTTTGRHNRLVAGEGDVRQNRIAGPVLHPTAEIAGVATKGNASEGGSTAKFIVHSAAEPAALLAKVTLVSAGLLESLYIPPPPIVRGCR